MKALFAALLLFGTTVALLVPIYSEQSRGSAVEGAAAPDPRDSVILESKTVAPQSGPCASAILKVRVYITNKDSLSNITLPFETKSISGSAYAILSRPANCGARTLVSYTFNVLYPVGPNRGVQRLPDRAANYSRYHSDSPDTILLAFTMDNPAIDDQKVPPNLTRAPWGELKFDSVFSTGQFQIDSSKVLSNTIQFVALQGNTIFVNFVKSVITVAPKGDMNLDGILTAADVVLVRNCVVLGIPPPAGAAACDLNCDGIATASDFVLLLNATFLGDPFPC